MPPPPIVTWEVLQNQILATATTEVIRKLLKKLCDNNILFLMLKESLKTYHNKTEYEKLEEEGFRILTELYKYVSDISGWEFEGLPLEAMFDSDEDSNTFRGVFEELISVIKSNILAIGIKNSELDDSFHFVNIASDFSVFELGNLEAWIIALNRKESPPAINFWIDKDNLLINELYAEISKIAARRAMNTWRATYPERAPVLQRIRDERGRYELAKDRYQNNPSQELLQYVRIVLRNLRQLEEGAYQFLDEFKEMTAAEGIMIQNEVYDFIRTQPREEWNNLRLRFMQEHLQVPEENILMYTQKLEKEKRLIDKVQDELSPKYPNLIFHDIEEAFDIEPALTRFYNRELLLRMDPRRAYNCFILMILKLKGGNVMGTKIVPPLDRSIQNIIDGHTIRTVELPNGQSQIQILYEDKNAIESSIKERIIKRKILKIRPDEEIDICYNAALPVDRQIIDAIWQAIEILPADILFRSMEPNYSFKNLVKSTDEDYFNWELPPDFSIVSANNDSPGLQAMIEHMVEFNGHIEENLSSLATIRTRLGLRDLIEIRFGTTSYENLNVENRDFKSDTIIEVCFNRMDRFLKVNDFMTNMICGGTAINRIQDILIEKRYNETFSFWLMKIRVGEDSQAFKSYFVNDGSLIPAKELHNLFIPQFKVWIDTENLFMGRIEKVLRFRDFFDRKAMQFYELGEAHSAESIQFLPQDLLLSSYEYPEGLCLSLSLLQGMADDYLDGATIFASDISAISALQVDQFRNQLSQSDAQSYTEYSRQLRELNKVANKNFFNESTSVFQNTGSATLATLETVLSSLTFEREVRYLLTTPNHGMTLSRKGDLYTFYDSNIGYVRFDSQEKVGAFIRAHLDLKHGLGTHYGLTDATTVNISGYTNSDLWAFENVSYFRSILSQGGAELTVDRLSSLDRENGMLSIGTARFKRTELVAMGGKYKGFAMDENTPFATADFWDQVTFDSQKLLRFIYDHEADTATINRLEALKQIGKLQTDGGIVSLADLTGGKATNHIDPLHYTILESSRQIADLYDRFSIKLKNTVDQLGLNLEEYRFKTGEVEKLTDHQYKMVLVHKETGQEVPLTLDGKEFENVVSEHIATLGESSESALALGGAGLGLMGLIRGATALRSGHGSGYDIASVVLGGKQLADAILGTVAMAVIGDTLTASGTVFSFSIEGTLANLCEQTAVRIGGTIGKLLTSVSMFLKLPLIGLNVWGLYEDVTYLNSADSGPARAVAISQLVTDSIVTALTLASFAVPEVAIPALIVGAVGMGFTAIVQNLANAHDRYYKLTEWQDRLREIASSYSPVPNTRNRNLADLSKNQLCGDVRLVLSDDRKNPHQLTYTKSCDTAIRYGHHPEKSPQEVRNAIGYGYSYTSPIGPFAREEFFDPIRSPFNIGWGLIDRVILGYGSRYQLMTQVEYISDWLLYDSRNGRASGGYWETFYTRANYNSIQQDGASCTVIGNSLDNTFITPDIVNWSDAKEASYIIEQHANYQFNITTGVGNNVVVLGQTGRYLLDGGSGNNTLDLSQVQLNLNVDLDITGYQSVYMGNDRYSNCIKVAVSNFNIVRCSLSNFELHREVVVKGQSNKPNVFVLGRMSRVSVYGRGGGNTYILNKISNRSAEFRQIINLYIQAPVSGNTDVSVERVYFEEYKLSDLNNVTFSLTGGVNPVLTLEGLALQLIHIGGCKVHDNAVSNVQFSTLDGFSFYYDHKLKKGVVTQVDYEKWKEYNQDQEGINSGHWYRTRYFNFDLFETLYKNKFVVADQVVCINNMGTMYLKLSTKKAILLVNLKTKVTTIPGEFKDFAWTIALNHSAGTILIPSYMCNLQKPLIVFETHSLSGNKSTIDFSDFESTYIFSARRERNSLLIRILNRSNSNKTVTLLFKDVYNQDINQTIANKKIVLKRSDIDLVKLSNLQKICKKVTNENFIFWL
ncbi:TcdA/TcdB catalytic glycosyltransferase domain-containing protein [Flavobacterium cerinum]|uniref:Uncharacterized protein n=1 Tax=Flavobacterium cerinum TaxID=2502784 RepID=A0ABY5INN9_9FLAO|nr:TcdA/TcdB catalytic glycosyltransferase domain-containing protein [Flavobacterium cerinum]UUC44457.1 hypothetical protein NOX80_12545 [Flavobacterium cerinum]